MSARSEACSPCAPNSYENCGNKLPKKDAPAWCFAHVYDPEGALATVPSVMSTWLGLHFGHVIKTPWLILHRQRLAHWYSLSAFLMVVGLIIDEAGLEMNKQLWTPSYLFFMAGLLLFFYPTIFFNCILSMHFPLTFDCEKIVLWNSSMDCIACRLLWRFLSIRLLSSRRHSQGSRPRCDIVPSPFPLDFPTFPVHGHELHSDIFLPRACWNNSQFRLYVHTFTKTNLLLTGTALLSTVLIYFRFICL